MNEAEYDLWYEEMQEAHQDGKCGDNCPVCLRRQEQREQEKEVENE